MASLCRRLLVKAPSFCRVLNRTTTTVSSNLCRNVKRNHLDNLQRRFSSAKPLTQKETVTIHFLARDGERMTVKAKVGDNLLDTIVDEDVDLDGFGACEGTLACSTCHLIFKTEDYDKIDETPTDEELDMLDLAFGLEDTSRLGCQVIVTKEMDGWEIRVPEGVADAREP